LAEADRGSHAGFQGYSAPAFLPGVRRKSPRLQGVPENPGRNHCVHETSRSGDRDLTIVFDKGMNSEDNIVLIDAAPKMHFITSYSPHYADHLIRVKLSNFAPVDTLNSMIKFF
jgi:hypothetical protein